MYWYRYNVNKEIFGVSKSHWRALWKYNFFKGKIRIFMQTWNEHISKILFNPLINSEMLWTGQEHLRSYSYVQVSTELRKNIWVSGLGLTKQWATASGTVSSTGKKWLASPPDKRLQVNFSPQSCAETQPLASPASTALKHTQQPLSVCKLF